jgi:hypothetical protein
MTSAIIFRTWSDQEAQIVKGILELYGIPVCLDTDLSHALYPLSIDGLGEIRVLVPGAAGDEARAILDGYRSRSVGPDA